MMRKILLITSLIIPLGLTSSIILFKPVPVSSGLSTKGELLLEKELLDPWRKKLGEKKEMVKFSRCPQGVTYRITSVPSTENPNFEGRVMHYSACDQNILCYFRITEDEDLLYAKIEQTDEWTHPSVLFLKDDLSRK